jgi:hypothetical protein
MSMNMTLIDNVMASTIEPGDVTEFFDTETRRTTLETVLRVEDEGKYILVYTEENPDDPYEVEPFRGMRLFGYVDE